MDKGGYEEALRYLVARHMDVYVVQILSQEEIDPPLTGDLKLTDVEDGDEAEVTVSAPLLKKYKENLAAYPRRLHEFCTRRGVNYLFTSNQVPFDRLVLGYLRQRGLLRADVRFTGSAPTPPPPSPNGDGASPNRVRRDRHLVAPTGLPGPRRRGDSQVELATLSSVCLRTFRRR